MSDKQKFLLIKMREVVSKCMSPIVEAPSEEAIDERQETPPSAGEAKDERQEVPPLAVDAIDERQETPPSAGEAKGPLHPPFLRGSKNGQKRGKYSRI